MEDLTITPSPHDFSPVHAAMRRYVDQDILPGVSHALLRGRDVIDLGCVGWADKENQIPLRTDHLFRAMSNTKLVTSCAVLLLFEEGRFKLDDPIDPWLPQLANRRVLKADATTLDDTEPADRPITIRHLLTHTSGLSYGLLDPGTLLFTAYTERQVNDPRLTLAQMMDRLTELPLRFQPGTFWEYSVATDVLGRLVEVVSGQTLDKFFQQRIFDRLGMVDTTFTVPEAKQDRLTAHYAGADLMNPMKPGLTRIDNAPYPGAYRTPFPKLSGGGGLVTSLPDMIALVRGLLPGGPTLLKPDTLAMMMTNQLPSGLNIRFARIGEVPGKGHGLAGAVTVKPAEYDPPASTGEFQWGGIAGTHWWISLKHNLAGVLMTQRHMAFWHPFAFEFKQLGYRVTGH